jgi:hypothetical protein
MSTKTTFKRIALVAVAALGLGVLSVAPSSAAISSLVITATNGSNGNTAGTVIDTTTAARIVVTALTSESSDSISVTAVRKSGPAGSSASTAKFAYEDTGTATTLVSRDGGTTTLQASLLAADQRVTTYDSASAGTGSAAAIAGYSIAGAVGYKSASFLVTLETGTAHTAGDYVYTVIANTYKNGVLQSAQVVQDVTITVAALATASKVVDTSKSSATISLGASWAGAAGTDSVVSTLATASATVKAVIRVINNNASSGAVAESITVTVTGPGVVRKNGETSAGKSIVVVGTGSDDIEVLSDGTAGTSSIAVKTTSATYAAKTVTFYAASPATVTLSVARPVIEASGSSTADVVRATFNDANGNRWAGDAYIYATTAAGALVAGSETPSLCVFDPADNRHECALTGKTIGSASFKVIDKATVATATLTSSEVSVRSAAALPATAKLVFDKASYGPGEKATLSVILLDAAGLAVPGKTYADIFATGGITPSVAFSAGSVDITGTSVAIASASSSTTGATAGQVNYTVYMPMSTGTVTVTATGSTGLPVAARVATTATAEVVNSSVDAATDAANEATDAANAATDAALAAADAADAATAAAQDASDAVAALSATVAKLVASLKAQITSLTNLVIKIQKKVKA